MLYCDLLGVKPSTRCGETELHLARPLAVSNHTYMDENTAAVHTWLTNTILLTTDMCSASRKPALFTKVVHVSSFVDMH